MAKTISVSVHEPVHCKSWCFLPLLMEFQRHSRHSVRQFSQPVSLKLRNYMVAAFIDDHSQHVFFHDVACIYRKENIPGLITRCFLSGTICDVLDFA